MTDDIDPALVERCAKAMADAPRTRDGVRHDIEAVLTAAGVPEMIAAMEKGRDALRLISIDAGSYNEAMRAKEAADVLDAALKKAKGEGVMRERFICTPETPWREGLPTPVEHPKACEVGEQENGWPGGDNPPKASGG